MIGSPLSDESIEVSYLDLRRKMTYIVLRFYASTIATDCVHAHDEAGKLRLQASCSHVLFR